MRRLFRSCERFGVKYLLISGQASVLYGAASFSEDVDLWVEPAPSSASRLLKALAQCGARVHKLTPPLERAFMRAGHGYHFRLPPDVYLDVMFMPPRVGSFRMAAKRCVRMRTPWGRVPVVAIEDLVELKKTRRLYDYEVISALAKIRLETAPDADRPLLRWAVSNSFRVEQRAALLQRLGRPMTTDECIARIAADVARLQKRDVTYWRRRIHELGRLRRAGRLLPEGLSVRTLL